MPVRLAITIFFILGSVLLYSQENILQTRVNLNLEKATFEEALKMITEKSGVHFSYNARHVRGDKRISLIAGTETLEAILDKICLEFDLEYTVVRNQIVIKKKPPRPETGKKFTLSGFVRDKASAETLPGASVFVKELNTGTITNAYGFFSLSLPPGEYEFIYSFVGYSTQGNDLALNQNIQKIVELESASLELAEVIVFADQNIENLQKSQSGKINANPRSLERLPEFAGESGLIKSLQTLPGIQTHSDGSSFFFVRGGNKDQNLILIDEAPVYNPAHLFGFYSVIIPDVAKDISIYKADMPVEKSGRLSSVIDVQTRDGNMKKFSAEGVLNPIMVRFSVEGPIVNEKVSFFTSYRRSIVEWFYKTQIPDADLYIMDFNAKLNWQINKNNRVYFSHFIGNDNYTNNSTQDKTGIAWQNMTSTLRWNHIFNERLFSNATFYASEYNYSLFTGAFPWESGIKNVGLKYDLSWFVNPSLTWRSGFSHTLHEFNPGNFSNVDESARPFVPRVYAGKATETAIYVSREKQINEHWAWRAGISLPLWVSTGPAIVYGFDESRNVTDTLIFQDGKMIKSYFTPDLRLSARYRISEHASLKFSWGNYHQNLHLLSNSISPFSSFEIWMPSGKNIKPQLARQVTAGFSGLNPANGLEFEAELYYKRMLNQIEYENHAQLLLNPLLEGELFFGQARAYGLELFIRRTKGRLTGWAGYTYSRVFNRFEEINNNEEYPAFYDRPNDFSVFLTWQISRKLILSLNWIYYTGSAITTPTGFYYYNGSMVPQYGEKNNDRLPDYHRLDISLNRIFGKTHHRYQHSLNFAIYNLYNRHNPVSINFNKVKTQNGNYVIPANLHGTHEIMSTQKYMGGIMPSLTYKFSIISIK